MQVISEVKKLPNVCKKINWMLVILSWRMLSTNSNRILL